MENEVSNRMKYPNCLLFYIISLCENVLSDLFSAFIFFETLFSIYVLKKSIRTIFFLFVIVNFPIHYNLQRQASFFE